MRKLKLLLLETISVSFSSRLKTVHATFLPVLDYADEIYMHDAAGVL